MTNKTISINPSLFAVGGAKTKKNREKKQKPTTVPLISPNVLKNKLLKRIKEHKQRETENLENVGGGENRGTSFLSNKAADIIVSDEFMESIEYLKTLSDERKKRTDRASIEKRRSDLERNTVKHYQALNNSESSHQQVNIELPEELSAPLIKINTANLSAVGGESVSLSPYKNDIVPYGVLKGGLKPTFKDWNKTMRSNIVTDSNLALTIQGGGPTSEKSARENRLANLRTKLKQKQASVPTNAVPIITVPSADPATSVMNVVPTSVVIMNDTPMKNITANEGGTIATKRTTKRTIKRKYTLGRSKIQKTVAVLIKDRSTRRQVLHAQKDLKRKPIDDVKSYLREHNLIKLGSSTPNDIMRKMYESAMLAGEIKNSNVETLLHNFSKEEREL
jgi:hypothetical protein